MAFWLAFTLLLPPVTWAEMVSTQAAIEAQQPPAGEPRERIYTLLKRKGVQRRLQEFGLSPQEAERRIGSLTDEEVRHLAQQIDAYTGAPDPQNEGPVMEKVNDMKEAVSYSIIIVLGIAVAGCVAICPFFLY